jgi:hypothetical protein
MAGPLFPEEGFAFSSPISEGPILNDLMKRIVRHIRNAQQREGLRRHS